MKHALSIIHIGVPMDHPTIPEEARPAVIRRLSELHRALNARGFTYEMAYYSPESGLEDFGNRLRAACWDGVLIGAGVVRTPSLAYFMEQIVDVTRSAAPQAKIMFIHGVEDVDDALHRWFGV